MDIDNKQEYIDCLHGFIDSIEREINILEDLIKFHDEKYGNKSDLFEVGWMKGQISSKKRELTDISILICEYKITHYFNQTL